MNLTSGAYAKRGGAVPETRQTLSEEILFSVAQGRATCRSVAQREKRGSVPVRRDSTKQGVEMEATRIMALKFKVKSKDAIPAELANLYVERDALNTLGPSSDSRLRLGETPAGASSAVNGWACRPLEKRSAGTGQPP